MWLKNAFMWSSGKISNITLQRKIRSRRGLLSKSQLGVVPLFKIKEDVMVREELTRWHCAWRSPIIGKNFYKLYSENVLLSFYYCQSSYNTSIQHVQSCFFLWQSQPRKCECSASKSVTSILSWNTKSWLHTNIKPCGVCGALELTNETLTDDRVLCPFHLKTNLRLSVPITQFTVIYLNHGLFMEKHSPSMVLLCWWLWYKRWLLLCGRLLWYWESTQFIPVGPGFAWPRSICGADIYIYLYTVCPRHLAPFYTRHPSIIPTTMRSANIYSEAPLLRIFILHERS